MKQNNKILSGIKKIAIAMLFGLGPVVFLSAKNQLETISGIILMILSFGFGLWGVREIVSSFFDNSNE